MLPTHLKKFFWDVRLGDVDLAANKAYIISRLLELGDEAAINWLEHQFSPDDLRRVVKTTRSLSPKSRNYWTLKYHVA